jgi:NAD(P)H-hydrate epimerase
MNLPDRQYNEPMSSPSALYSVSQVRALDAYAIGTLGISGYTLMKRAGEAALRALRSRWPRALRIAVVAGGGNNGGDGYVLARFGQAAGLSMTVLAAVPPERLRGDGAQAAADFRASGGEIRAFAPAALAQAEVIVDALLGTGLSRTIGPEVATVIGAINAAQRPVFALDLPSGLNGDTGAVMGAAVRADSTISFVALKVGLFTGQGPDHAGRVQLDDLEVVPPAADPAFRPVLERLTDAEITRVLPRRARTAHKGDFGRVLIIGGGVGMPGAARLTGEACLRTGAGLVTVACAPQNVAAIASGRPELICLGVESARQLEHALQATDVIGIGPGLGTTPWARELLHATLAAGKPLVLDADALNILADEGITTPAQAVITPHPGEAARLLNTATADVQADRIASLQALLVRHPCIAVLKGAGTLIGGSDRIPAICERGNPGMAAPGMGDVLTGAIAGVLAQCRDPWQAARVGVLVHALAGDDVARERGERGLLALDVAEALSRRINAGL